VLGFKSLFTHLSAGPFLGVGLLCNLMIHKVIPMDKINQRINELCSAIIHESDASKVIGLASELNRLLVQKIDKMDENHKAQPSTDPTPENA
jgi:hypothetical protein